MLRKLPGSLGHPESALEESFSNALGGAPEYPHYTRPAEYRGWKVPDVLLSGHHAEIAKYRRRESLRRTLERRPDLLEQQDLGPEDRKILKGLTRDRGDVEAC